MEKLILKKFMKMEKKGVTSGSFNGKKCRYLVPYIGSEMYDCWKTKRNVKD